MQHLSTTSSLGVKLAALVLFLSSTVPVPVAAQDTSSKHLPSLSRTKDERAKEETEAASDQTFQPQDQFNPSSFTDPSAATQFSSSNSGAAPQSQPMSSSSSGLAPPNSSAGTDSHLPINSQNNPAWQNSQQAWSGGSAPPQPQQSTWQTGQGQAPTQSTWQQPQSTWQQPAPQKTQAWQSNGQTPPAQSTWQQPQQSTWQQPAAGQQQQQWQQP
ncbi:MAG TPA: hypothetical protein V6C69_13470, partial [Trichormus sp.]